MERTDEGNQTIDITPFTPGWTQPGELVRMALERDLREEARAAIATMLESREHRAEAWFLRGVLALIEGENGVADDAFGRALAEGLADRSVRLGAAMSALALGRADDAWRQLESLAAEVPGDAEILHWCLRAAVEADEFEGALLILERHIALRPDDTAARFARAAIAARLGQDELARAERDEIARRDPEFAGLDAVSALVADARRAA